MSRNTIIALIYHCHKLLDLKPSFPTFHLVWHRDPSVAFTCLQLVHGYEMRDTATQRTILSKWS
jgi:hypothetical protein